MHARRPKRDPNPVMLVENANIQADTADHRFQLTVRALFARRAGSRNGAWSPSSANLSEPAAAR